MCLLPNVLVHVTMSEHIVLPWFHLTLLMFCFGYPGDPCRFQEGKGEGDVQEEGRCSGWSLHVAIDAACLSCPKLSYCSSASLHHGRYVGLVATILLHTELSGRRTCIIL